MVRNILITGAEGYIGRLTTEALAAGASEDMTIVAADVRRPEHPIPGVIHEILDITHEDAVSEMVGRYSIEAVIHLAAIVTPGGDQTRDLQYAVDVGGTENILAACVDHGVERFVYTSSGAAYGYHPANGALLEEDEPLRGNEEFAYAWHKRIVEELLADYRKQFPQLAQVIFRVSTILGPRVNNQITAMFERPVILGLSGVQTPFCLVDDRDVVGALIDATFEDYSGVYNLSGDGVLTLREIAAMMDRRYLALPEAWVRRGLETLDDIGVAPYGPEQTMFLAYRPVLSNQKLKEELGFRPRSSREVFERYLRSRQKNARPISRRADDVPVRSVLVTGAAGGLGGAIAARHAERGDRLILFDRDAIGLQRTSEELRGTTTEMITVEGDVRDERDCQRAVDAALDAFGSLDILYNNAAVPLRGFFEDISNEEITRVIDVNLMGSVRMTRVALPALRASRGRIATISSVAGFAPLTGRTAYAASKHALHGFFESLRSEIEADGITVSLACPAYIATDFRRGARDGVDEMSVDDAARHIVEGVDARQKMILVGQEARLAWWASRLAPKLFETLMRRSVRDEFPT